MRGKLL